ncbi:MAG: NUDIX hydrolase [Spirochaetaceae bacterium JB067]
MKTDLTVGAFIFCNDELLLIYHRKLRLWLPPGGHIEKDETPDDAVLREIQEETALNVKLLNVPQLPAYGAVVKHLATPFYVNVHNVGDHDHVGFYYIASAEDKDQVTINEDELTSFKWFTLEELEKDERVTKEVRSLSRKAFTEFSKVDLFC